MQLVDRDLLVDGDRDDLLGEHVERVARDLRLLDLAVPHRARDDGGLEQVGPELREDAALRNGAELVAGAADPLEAARDGLRRLDLDHEVDGAHVDPELERRGRDETRDPAGLQILLDHDALLAREACRGAPGRARCPASSLSRRASRSASRRLLTKTIVERCCSTSASSSGYIEGQIEAIPCSAGGGFLALREDGVRERGGRAELAQVLDRDDDLQVELLARARVDELDSNT